MRRPANPHHWDGEAFQVPANDRPLLIGAGPYEGTSLVSELRIVGLEHLSNGLKSACRRLEVADRDGCGGKVTATDSAEQRTGEACPETRRRRSLGAVADAFFAREGSDTDDDKNSDAGILDRMVNPNQADEDALWQGEGRGRRHVDYVDAQCLRCGVVQAVASENSSFTCSSRHSQDFFRCFDCKGTFQSGHVGDQCPWCLSGQLDGRVTSWDWAADQRRHPDRVALPSQSVELGHYGADTDRRFLHGFLLAACGGSEIPVHTRCDIDFAQGGITIRGPFLVNESVRYEDVEALQVTGSTTRRSAGVFGGGFGVIGAAEGILAAAVINSLTTRTKIYTVVRIATTKSEYVFVSYKLDSDAVQMSLVPVQLRIRRARAADQNPVSQPSPSSGSVADELTKLARLHESGALDDAEFRSAKTRLLRDA